MAKAKRSGGSSGGAKKQAGEGARGGISQQVRPDAKLAKVIGDEPVTRAELTKRIWDYVKKNDLQDSNDRRQINADENLRPIFGKDQVSMFEMTKLVNQHVS